MLFGEALLDHYDRMKCGAVLLDASGSVLCLNAVAERCLTQHSSAAGPQSRLEPQRATQALRRLLGGPTYQEALRGAPRALRHRSDRRLVVRLHTMSELEGEAAALLMLLDLDECLQPEAASLQEIFGLTKAEARLAVRLVCGETIEDIAEEHNITVSTARVQLKSVFAKTGTSRQAELVALLTRLTILV
jgi:DNA-binding CsgD family transcriptional regulator